MSKNKIESTVDFFPNPKSQYNIPKSRINIQPEMRNPNSKIQTYIIISQNSNVTKFQHPKSKPNQLQALLPWDRLNLLQIRHPKPKTENTDPQKYLEAHLNTWCGSGSLKVISGSAPSLCDTKLFLGRFLGSFGVHFIESHFYSLGSDDSDLFCRIECQKE